MTETWNPNVPLITNLIASDIPDFNENYAYLMQRLGYWVDVSESDQGANGDGNSIKDLIDAIGTDTTATLFFPHHAEDGDTTTYVVSTNIDLTTYPNLYLKIQPGALIQPAVGVTLTVYSPEHIIASPQQQIVDTTNNSTNPVAFTVSGTVYPQWWGVSGDATDELTNSQAAVTAGLGGTIVFKKTSSRYEVSDAINVTGADTEIVVEEGAEIRIDSADDTKHLFNITGVDFKIGGGGTLAGDGTFLQDGTGGSLLYINAGHRAKIQNLRFENAPGASIQLHDVDDAKISDFYIDGGISAKSDSNHYGIFLDSAKRASISNGTIKDCVQGVYGGTYGRTLEQCSVTNIKFETNFDHGIYIGSGSRNRADNNIFAHTQSGSGAAIVFRSSYGSVTNNIISTIGEGINVRDGLGVKCTGNDVYQNSADAQYGIVFNRLALSYGDVLENVISNNRVEAVGADSAHGIYLVALTDSSTTTGVVSRNVITGNIVKGFDLEGISLQTPNNSWSASEVGHHNIISNNLIYDVDTRGIYILRNDDCVVEGNIVEDAGIRGIELDMVTNSVISNNKIDAASTGIWERSNAGTSANNQFVNNYITGASAGNRLTLVDTDSTVDYSTPFGAVGTMSGHETFTLDAGKTFHKDAGGTPRNFNPTGVFVAGWTVTIVNTGGETITFDSAGLNQAVATAERGIFQYSGSAWVQIYVG